MELCISTQEKLEYNQLKIEVEYILDEGEIEGAEFCAAVPTHKDRSLRWTKKNLLIFCHGCRPEGIQKVADLDLWDEVYNTLLQEGWIVAMTSYRREGRIINDAIQDVHNLRDYISRKYGLPNQVILEGSSMGGHIVVLIAEQQPELYQGVLAVGAALLPKGNAETHPFNYNPKIPLIFLTNDTETGPIKQYIQMASNSTVTPVLWTVSRQGHCNVNSEERWKAFRGLLYWIKTKHQLESDLDITEFLPPKPSQVTFDDPQNPSNGGAWGKVHTFDVYGDIFLNFQESDIDALGIKPGKKLQIVVKMDDYVSKTFKGYRGTSGDSFDISIPQGEWMIWVAASGYVMLCKNASWVEITNAAAQAAVVRGTLIYLKSLLPPPPKKLKPKNL